VTDRWTGGQTNGHMMTVKIPNTNHNSANPTYTTNCRPKTLI